MSAPTAVIDLGTNTFHLLIASRQGDRGLQEIYRERIFVKLASEGIEKIGPQACRRAVAAIVHFKSILDDHKIRTVRAIGTAALRTASNGTDLVKDIYQKTGITIELISGDEEARLIHKGVTHAVPLSKENGLIMDIGGGSVEFIIASQQGVQWAQSFPIGVAVLYKEFHHNDPISTSEISVMYASLTKKLQPLFQQLKKHPVTSLIGASGTFDVVEKFLTKENSFSLYASVPTQKFYPFSQKIIHTTVDQRLAMEALPDSRADLIVVALLLIEFILKQLNINTIYTSAYAMKEGILLDS